MFIRIRKAVLQLSSFDVESGYDLKGESLWLDFNLQDETDTIEIAF